MAGQEEGSSKGALLLHEGEWRLISEEAEIILKIGRIPGEFDPSSADYPTPPNLIFYQIIF